MPFTAEMLAYMLNAEAAKYDLAAHTAGERRTTAAVIEEVTIPRRFRGETSPLAATDTLTTTELPISQLITDTQSAETPQAAVEIVLDAFNNADDSDRVNFDGGKTLEVKEDEGWIIATDWMTTTLPAGIEVVNTDQGYGVFYASDEFAGTVPAGVGVKVKKAQESKRQVFLPEIKVEFVKPTGALISQIETASTPQEAGAMVLEVFNVTPDGQRVNFEGGAQLDIAAGETYLIWTDWGSTIPARANSLNSEGGYGVFWIQGPWNGEVPAGVGIRWNNVSPTISDTDGDDPIINK